jgi:general secretion pathway protein J
MTRPPPLVPDGFTLVELLIALALFALLSIAGLLLLRTSVDSQSAISRRLDQQGRIERLRALLANEFGTAVGRIGRDAQGARHAAFIGWPQQIAFVSIGEEAGTISRVEAIGLRFTRNQLVMTRSHSLDGILQGEESTLLRDLRDARFRYRADDGQWRDQWQAEQPHALPRAVELNLRGKGLGPLTLHIPLAPDGVAPMPDLRR